jgi:hypothetical protein
LCSDRGEDVTLDGVRPALLLVRQCDRIGGALDLRTGIAHHDRKTRLGEYFEVFSMSPSTAISALGTPSRAVQVEGEAMMKSPDDCSKSYATPQGRRISLGQILAALVGGIGKRRGHPLPPHAPYFVPARPK